MSMTTLQFYKNKYYYPDYSKTLTPYGNEILCTPVGVNLKSGTIKVMGNMQDFMNCNYLSLTRDNETIYAYIEDVSFHTAESFQVTYKVDPFRTYINDCSLGVQYVTRHPEPNSIEDPLLGSLQAYPDIESIMHTPSNSDKRYFVVQTRVQSGEIISPTPVQPSPYRFYFCPYDVNRWQDAVPINQLISNMTTSAKPQNIVTMYSIPYVNLEGLTASPLTVIKPDSNLSIDGWYMISMQTDMTDRLHLETTLNIPNKTDLLKVKHSVQVVIPEAGIINIADELLLKENLRLRQDIDLFSGASNYMLVTGTNQYYTSSCRGSSISSIPIVSDPYDTYISQNQNALATSLIGDMATIGGGIVSLGAGGGFMAGAGATGVVTGITNIIKKKGNIDDIVSKSYSNPPAFLGSALATSFSQKFWVVITKENVTNSIEVNTNFGYPCEMFKALAIPTSGYIETKNCRISSNGNVPRWAIEEINNIFNSGLRVK